MKIFVRRFSQIPGSLPDESADSTFSISAAPSTVSSAQAHGSGAAISRAQHSAPTMHMRAFSAASDMQINPFHMFPHFVKIAARSRQSIAHCPRKNNEESNQGTKPGGRMIRSVQACRKLRGLTWRPPSSKTLNARRQTTLRIRLAHRQPRLSVLDIAPRIDGAPAPQPEASAWYMQTNDKRPTRNILVSFHALGIGGGERVTCALAEIWQSLGMNVTIVTDLPVDQNQPHQDIPAGVGHRVIPDYNHLTGETYPARSQALSEIIEETHADTMVFAHWFADSLPFDLLTCKAHGLKTYLFIQSLFARCSSLMTCVPSLSICPAVTNLQTALSVSTTPIDSCGRSSIRTLL